MKDDINASDEIHVSLEYTQIKRKILSKIRKIIKKCNLGIRK